MSSPTRNSTISSSHKKHSLKNNTTTSLPITNNKKQKQGDTDIASRALAALHSDTDDNSMDKNDMNNNSDNSGVVQSDKENSVSETQDVDKETFNTATIMHNATKTTLDFTEQSMNDIVDMTSSNTDSADGKRKSFDNFDNQLLSTEDTDIIIPHSSTSQYNNILSSYLSTPFDKHAMISLHCTKEGLSNNNNNNNNNNSLYSSHNSPHSKSRTEKESKFRSFSRI